VLPDGMPAAVYVDGGSLEVRRLPVPEPAPDEVLVEVSHCGICGTDLHLVLERYARPGSVLGHEWSGTVVAAGREAGDWEEGARAVEPSALPRAPMGRPVADPFTVAFECSGHASAAEAALDQLDYAGTLVFVGTGHEMPRVNHNRMIVLELSAIGAYNYDAGGFRPALDLLASGTLPLDLLIEPDDVALDDLLATMRRLAAGELAGKVMVRP
jgi:threonine dehydrogenase-like Zn-dependent dehydrogenase